MKLNKWRSNERLKAGNRATADTTGNVWVRLSELGEGDGMSIHDFTVSKELGRGGFGTVLLVRENASGRIAALKAISKRAIVGKEEAERVLLEAEAMQDVRHPLVISHFASFQDAAHVYFLLELAEGGTLKRQLRRHGGSFPEDWCRFYCAEMSLAISHVHSRDFVYRDLKLENVLISAEGHVKLADFGLATRQRSSAAVGKVVGTPHMLAPEVLTRAPHGNSIDWWGIGLILCEMLLGQAPLGWVQGPEDVSALPNVFKKGLHIPSWMEHEAPPSPPARDVAEALLKVAPSQRLGCTSGIAELQRQAWFRGLAGVWGSDWGVLARLEVPAPLVTSEHNKLTPTSGSVTPKDGDQKVDFDGKDHHHAFRTSDVDQIMVFKEAAYRGDIATLRNLLRAGASADAGDFDERTPLHVVCSSAESSSLQVAQFLVEEQGADVNAVDRWGFTPLQDALRSGRDDVIRYLRSKGARSGKMPYADIFNAAAVGDMALLRRLVATGADVNAADYDSRRALHVAASNGLLGVCTFLVDVAGAQHSPADRWGNTPLGNALFSGNHEVADFLRKRGATGAIHAQSDLANNAFNLNEAAFRGDVAALRRLVANGVDVNEGDYDSRRALHLAASEGRLDVVRFLVSEAGADPSPVDRWGNTPVADAEHMGNAAVVEFLRWYTDQGCEELGEDIEDKGRVRKSSSAASLSKLELAELVPPLMKLSRDPLKCPLTERLFQCPMVATDGFTYEHAAFEAWIAKHGLISPITGGIMPSYELFPNRVVDALALKRRRKKKDNKGCKPIVVTKICLLRSLAIALVFFAVLGGVIGAALLTQLLPDKDAQGETLTDFAFYYNGKDEEANETKVESEGELEDSWDEDPLRSRRLWASAGEVREE